MFGGFLEFFCERKLTIQNSRQGSIVKVALIQLTVSRVAVEFDRFTGRDHLSIPTGRQPEFLNGTLPSECAVSGYALQCLRHMQ